MKSKVTPVLYLRKNWLLIAILCCIFFAGIYPKFGSKEGPLHTDLTVKYGAVFIIFFISGLSLQTESIWYTFRQYKLHLFIQLYTFIFIPIFTQLFVKILHVFGVNIWVLKGYD